MSFNNKVVLVTGASSGIGAAIAHKFAEHRANVAMVGIKEYSLKEVAENIAKVGKKPFTIVADVTKDANAERIVSETLSQFGKIDIFINNVGVGGVVGITDEAVMTEFDFVMNTNLRSAVNLTHLVAKHLIDTKGNIIYISSVAAQVVMESFTYGTSKAALDHFMRSIALELAPKGVRVNGISPGPVKTDIIKNMGISEEESDAEWENYRKNSPLKRVSEPVEIAEIALFLASDKAVGVTGSSYVCDNGMLLSR